MPHVHEQTLTLTRPERDAHGRQPGCTGTTDGSVSSNPLSTVNPATRSQREPDSERSGSLVYDATEVNRFT